MRDDDDLFRDRIASSVSGLLALLGIDADPLQSREHILLSNIFEHAWRQGKDLDIAGLIQAVQKPPVRKLGVFDVDTFFPAQKRFDLAMALEYAQALNPYDLKWFEEPGDPLDFELLSEVAAVSRNPIATGENLFSMQDARNLIRYGGLQADRDILQVDPEFLGAVGITQHLTPNRRNGLANLWQKIKGFCDTVS